MIMPLKNTPDELAHLFNLHEIYPVQGGKSRISKERQSLKRFLFVGAKSSSSTKRQPLMPVQENQQQGQPQQQQRRPKAPFLFDHQLGEEMTD